MFIRAALLVTAVFLSGCASQAKTPSETPVATAEQQCLTVEQVYDDLSNGALPGVKLYEHLRGVEAARALQFYQGHGVQDLASAQLIILTNGGNVFLVLAADSDCVTGRTTSSADFLIKVLAAAKGLKVPGQGA